MAKQESRLLNLRRLRSSRRLGRHCAIQGYSETLEKAVTVDFQKHPPRKVGTRSRPVWAPMFPAGLPFSVPEILEFIAFSRSGKLFQ